MPRLCVVAAIALAAACSRPAVQFSADNAHEHLRVLAGTIGSRPVGTAANARARDYLIDRLRISGFDVRVQETDAERPDVGLTAHVSNIIATRRGAREAAIALVAHYDSSPDAPGATDDGFGVGVVLEAARMLARRRQPAYTLVVLLTDAEEPGLLGAAAAVKDPTIATSVRVCINLDAIGSDGPAMLFEVGPSSGALVKRWARAAPQPRGASYAVEIYRRLPNDTDFSVFRRAGHPGLNFAAIGDSYGYHTARDGPERVTRRLLAQAGANLVAIVESLDRTDLSAPSPDVTYFDIAGATGLAYGRVVGRGIAIAAILLGLLAWLRVTKTLGALGDRRSFQTILWSVTASVVVGSALVLATWALRAAREVYHPWYAHPARFFVLLAVTGALAGWTMWRAATRLPVRYRANGQPLAIWFVALPVWILAAAFVEWIAPAAAYLWTIPLATAGVALNVAMVGAASQEASPPAPGVRPSAGSERTGEGARATTPEVRSRTTRATAVRIASVVVLAVAGALWLADLTALLLFMVAVLGRLPLVTPVYVYAAALMVAGVVIVPPLVASVVGRADRLPRPALWTAAWLTLWVVAAGLAYSAPAYTYDRPLRREVRYISDQSAGRAFWEIGGNEPGLDLRPDAAGRAEWQRVATGPPATIPLPRLGPPFTFRAVAPATVAPPATIAATLLPRDTETDLEVVAFPTEPGLAVTFVLPPGVRPLRANLPGTVSASNRWHATYLAPSPSGVAFRATFGAARVGPLAQTVVLLTTARLPGGTGWQQLPAWLPQEHAVWSASATYILPAFAVAPATAARPEPVERRAALRTGR